MESAAPEYEAERLRAVRSMNVSSGERVERVPGLHGIVKASAQACGTQMAAVVIVEEAELVVVAAHGLAVTHLPRAGSFCSEAIKQVEVFEVPDATVDPRFAAESLTTQAPYVRFYAAAPLVSTEGIKLGTLCVLDSAPSALTEAQRAQLRTLSDAVVEILEARRTLISDRFTRADAASHANQDALRTLASGVGHEINNPLSFVATNLDFAVDELRLIATSHPLLSQTLDEVVTSIAEAKDGALRIRKIVRGLQSFANQELPKTPTNVESALEAAAAMARHELLSKATLEVQLDAVPPVLADDGGLTHVVVNLLLNAAQAFATKDPARNKVELRASRRGEQEVAISVSDNGPGIAADVLPRIFDPFFTTKPVGHGSGLGLSHCHTIVSSLGGELRCETELGRGTTFTVILPIAQPTQRASELPSSGTSTITRGRILLIDDEESLLRAMTRLLRPEHEVVAIADPRAALATLLDEGSPTFDVVFCDLMMPHVTGMSLFESVREVRPSVAERFVFMTAGAISDDARSFLAASRNPYVDKPFSSQVLRALAQKMVQKFAGRPLARASS